VGIVVTAAVVTANKYWPLLDNDDSTLNEGDYVGSWVLMAISGLFSTLGTGNMALFCLVGVGLIRWSVLCVS
jgi:hypothetical protein